jgi:DNA replication protein DnaC
MLQYSEGFRERAVQMMMAPNAMSVAQVSRDTGVSEQTLYNWRNRLRHQGKYTQQYSTRYYRLSRLLLELTQAKADGSYHKQLRQLAKVQLLIIDDWGLEALKPAERNDLMEIMDDRHGLTSTTMISQLPTDQWYASIGDNTLADSILDRLMHNAHRLQLKGESMRKIMSRLTDDEHLG